MTEPESTPVPSLAETASESPEKSIRRERETVGDAPDTGDLVPPENAQSAPGPD